MKPPRPDWLSLARDDDRLLARCARTDFLSADTVQLLKVQLIDALATYRLPMLVDLSLVEESDTMLVASLLAVLRYALQIGVSITVESSAHLQRYIELCKVAPLLSEDGIASGLAETLVIPNATVQPHTHVRCTPVPECNRAETVPRARLVHWVYASAILAAVVLPSCFFAGVSGFR